MLIFDRPANAPQALQFRIPSGMAWYALHEIRPEDNSTYAMCRSIISKLGPVHLDEIQGVDYGLNPTSSYLLAYGHL